MTTTPAKTPASPAKPHPTGTKITGLPDEIAFFCKDCNKVVPVNRVGRRYVYTCAECGTKNVAFGTANSIHSFFHIKEEEVEEEKEVKGEETTGKEPSSDKI